MGHFQTSNPFSGETLETYSYMKASEVDAHLEKSQSAFHSWSRLSLHQRLDSLELVKNSMAENLESLALQITSEMGKNIKEARAEVSKCLTVFEYVKREAERVLRSDFVHINSSKFEIAPEPLGSILVIMPWNFPLWQVVRVIVPALAVGNVILLKHAEISQGSAQKLTTLIKSVLPTGVFQNLVVTHEQCEKFLEDRRLQAVSMTASTRGGKAIAKTAGSQMKKMVFELGGADPYLVCADADIKKAAELCAKGRLTNSGQSCISAKRLIVRQEIFDSFIAEYEHQILKAHFGDPMDSNLDYGCLAHKRFEEQVHGQLDQLKSMPGSEVLFISKQKEIAHPSGFKAPFISPQALQMKNMKGLEDLEVFAPVTLVFRCDSDEKMLELANQSHYGLGGAVFSKDHERAMQLARQVKSGFVAINDYVRSDTHLPFGGVKDSGFGRELGEAGMREFINLKTLGGPI